jgi:hypothetical protein
MDDSVRWKDFEPSTMAWFLEHFTLHDSGLELVATNPDGSTVVSIGFDLHWNPSVPEDHAALRIRFDLAYLVVHSTGGWIQSTIQGANSAQLDGEQREALRVQGRFNRDGYQHSGTEFGFTFPPDDQSLTRSEFDCVNWGKLEVMHAASVRFAVAKDGGGPFVDLTTLSPEPGASG